MRRYVDVGAFGFLKLVQLCRTGLEKRSDSLCLSVSTLYSFLQIVLVRLSQLSVDFSIEKRDGELFTSAPNPL